MKYERPWLTPYQRKFLDHPARIKIIEASTKTGKTVSCIVWLFEQALQGKDGYHYWWVAPSYSQARIAYRRLKRFIKTKSFFSSNDSELAIKLKNGATIEFKTGEKPDNLYGEDVYAVVSDEATRQRPEAFYAIRSTLTATGGKWVLIGNVKGTQNYAYLMGKKAREGKLEDSAYFSFTILDAVKAGIVKEKEVEAARATLPPDVFDELYMCIPRREVQHPFAYMFNPDKHVTRGLTIDKSLPLYLSFDFNVDPITCIAAQWGHDWLYVIEETRIQDSNIYDLCQQVKAKYGHHKLIVTGDASGKSRSALAKASASNYYKVIAKELNIPISNIKLPKKNPPIERTQIQLNAMLHNHPDFLIDGDKCPYLVQDLRLVEVDDKGQINKAKDKHLTHLLDTLRYLLNTFHSDWHKKL